MPAVLLPPLPLGEGWGEGDPPVSLSLHYLAASLRRDFCDRPATCRPMLRRSTALDQSHPSTIDIHHACKHEQTASGLNTNHLNRPDSGEQPHHAGLMVRSGATPSAAYVGCVLSSKIQANNFVNHVPATTCEIARQHDPIRPISFLGPSDPALINPHCQRSSPGAYCLAEQSALADSLFCRAPIAPLARRRSTPDACEFYVQDRPLISPNDADQTKLNVFCLISANLR